MIDISVVVPSYKEDRLMKRMLNNLVRQTARYRMEIVIVEYDVAQTGMIVRSIRERFEFVPPIRVLRTYVKGIASARHEGIEAANGMAIVNFDVDCEFSHAECIEKLTKPIIYGEAVMTFCRGLLDVREAKTEAAKARVEFENTITPTQVMPVLIPGMCIHKDVYFEVGGLPFDKDPYEMLEFSPKVLWRYPDGIKYIKDAYVVASPRRLLKAKELGLEDEIFKRTTAVRGKRIIEGDFEEYYG